MLTERWQARGWRATKLRIWPDNRRRQIRTAVASGFSAVNQQGKVRNAAVDVVAGSATGAIGKSTGNAEFVRSMLDAHEPSHLANLLWRQQQRIQNSEASVSAKCPSQPVMRIYETVQHHTFEGISHSQRTTGSRSCTMQKPQRSRSSVVAVWMWARRCEADAKAHDGYPRV